MTLNSPESLGRLSPVSDKHHWVQELKLGVISTNEDINYQYELLRTRYLRFVLKPKPVHDTLVETCLYQGTVAQVRNMAYGTLLIH